MGSPTMMDPAIAARLQADATFGRNQWPELFFNGTVNLATPQTFEVPRQLNLNRPLEELCVTLRFRVTVGVQPYDAVSPEAPQNMLQRVRVYGTHRAYGAVTPWLMSGATAFAYPRCFQGLPGNDCLISVNGGPLTRVADPDRPFASGFLGTVGTHDIVLIWNLPTGPSLGGLGQNVKRQASAFMWMPQDWGNTLQVELIFGDATALGTPNAATTTAFSAFGSAEGLPQVRINPNYQILGDYAQQVMSGIVIRQERNLTSFTAAATDTRLDFLQQQITSGVLLKSGTTLTGSSPTVVTFGALSDLILESTQLRVDNKPVRNNQDNLTTKSYAQRQFATVVPEGYFTQWFTDAQQALTSYRGDLLAGGANFDLYTNILTTAAQQRFNYVQEQILGGVFPGRRP